MHMGENRALIALALVLAALAAVGAVVAEEQAIPWAARPSSASDLAELSGASSGVDSFELMSAAELVAWTPEGAAPSPRVLSGAVERVAVGGAVTVRLVGFDATFAAGVREALGALRDDSVIHALQALRPGASLESHNSRARVDLHWRVSIAPATVEKAVELAEPTAEAMGKALAPDSKRTFSGANFVLYLIRAGLNPAGRDAGYRTEVRALGALL